MENRSPRFSLWSFREDVYIETETADETVVIHSPWGELRLPRPSPAVLEALRRMSLGPISLENVIDTRQDRADLDLLLDRLQHLVVRSFGDDQGRPLISVVPIAREARFGLGTPVLELPVRLSKYVMLRTDGNDYCMESPLSLHRVLLHGAEALSLIGPLCRPANPSSIAPRTRHLVGVLMATGMVVQAVRGDLLSRVEFAEDTDPALVGWSPLELMVHTRTTLGRHDYDFGETHRVDDIQEAEPLVKPPHSGPSVPLYRPPWDELVASDPPFTTVLEATRHTCDFDIRPLHARELGELLYRSARIRAGDAADRPYLSNGRGYELELYVTVNECTGIPRGIYHYDPLEHRLEHIQADPAGIDRILQDARVAAGLNVAPPALITITSRFRRLTWKYESASYSFVLKNVGMLIQTLSLAGTAIGLATRSLEHVDITSTARLFQLDWRTESSVGGLAIGRRAR
ncbi:SagB family peptide dehydrogenase [Thermoactinospora rubra]|uniref:SagB family peptide dehydrogenase n=1 Tax=Thermoactinospora rubra TaxID=1088767 RepID=UPI001301D07F|nr:SagB family peptide dehydrogenase [Thermoactinospora rubra]